MVAPFEMLLGLLVGPGWEPSINDGIQIPTGRVLLAHDVGIFPLFNCDMACSQNGFGQYCLFM